MMDILIAKGVFVFGYLNILEHIMEDTFLDRLLLMNYIMTYKFLKNMIFTTKMEIG